MVNADGATGPYWRTATSRRNVLIGTALGLTAASGASGVAIASGGDDEGGGETEESPQEGESLTGDELQAFVSAFDDEPVRNDDDNQTPHHVWKWVNEDAFLFLEVDQDDVTEAERVEYVGVGVKGVFCDEAQPGPDDESAEGNGRSEFTHFHKSEADSWDGGHGGEPGAQGYWLMHTAVDEFERPWGEVSPGVDYDYGPTDPPACDEVPTVDFEPEGAEALTGDELQEFLAVFDDQPMTGGQETPAHVWKWVNEDVFLFLEVDEADVEAATAVEYVGIGVRGQFAAADQPHPDFTHFHRPDVAEWDEAHGGQAGDDGYWLIHTAVDEFERPWGEVSPGVDRAYGPTPPPDAEADSEADAEDVGDAVIETVRTDDTDRPFAFEPAEIEIAAGDTARWTNTDGVFHTVTATDSFESKVPNDTFDESLSEEGATFEYTFDEPGTYYFYCKPHSGFMEGTIHVDEA